MFSLATAASLTDDFISQAVDIDTRKTNAAEGIWKNKRDRDPCDHLQSYPFNFHCLDIHSYPFEYFSVGERHWKTGLSWTRVPITQPWIVRDSLGIESLWVHDVERQLEAILFYVAILHCIDVLCRAIYKHQLFVLLTLPFYG